MQREQSLVSTNPEHSAEDGEKILTRLTQENFASFVLQHNYTIICALHESAPASYPISLVGHMGVLHAPAVRMGLVSLSKIDWSPSVQLHVRLCLERLKLKPDGKGWPPSGFYLLAKGIPIGFHEGAVDLNKDGENVGPALVIGLVAAILTGDGKVGVTAGSQVARWNVGERIAKDFAHLIQQHEASS